LDNKNKNINPKKGLAQTSHSKSSVSNSQIENTISETKQSKNNLKTILQLFKEANTMEKSQIVLILCNIAAIVVFIWVGSCQHFDTKKSIALADSSLVLSQKSLKLAQQNFRTENRPFIGIQSITLNTLRIGERMSVNIVIQNYGKTPAKQVKIGSWIEYHHI